MNGLPRQTVTFLFTDLEGSTGLWVRHPDLMATTLARHERLLRSAIEARGGIVFKTIGDAVCAAFAQAGNALAAAIDAQRALAAETWPLPDPVRVRMAVHSGDAEPRDGDYVGMTVNTVARLLSAGHGGQILVSGSARELARDSIPKDASLRDLGEHRLRDLPRPIPIFQLLVTGLPTESPPLRTQGTRPHALPGRPTTLVGRDDERLQAGGLLRDRARLLTLTGPGGTGKTRLAIELAHDLLEEFQGEVHFVSLAQVVDPSLVPGTVAGAVGLREDDARDALADLEGWLAERRALLVLDNFEQVQDAAPFVARLIDVAPAVSVLVTSRSPLRLRGEREFPVPPLSFPQRSLPGIEILSDYAAVRLFTDRARAVKPTFELTPQNAPAVVEICRRVDGLPLAIELAAARTRLLSPQVMLERLSGRCDLLSEGPRDLPDRHRSLRATIRWSYDLLTPGEQALFRQLAVFARGCTLDAAEAVCGGCGDVLAGLSALVGESLLVQREEPDGDVRFSMLETIREFAAGLLEEAGEAEAVRARHAAWFRALAEQAEPELSGNRQSSWLERLERDHHNFGAALRWALDRKDPATALGLSSSLWRYWWVHGHMSEGRGWLTAALAAGPDAPLELRARALRSAGGLAWQQSDLEAAVQLLREALEIDRRLDNRRSVARDLLNLAGVLSDLGDHDGAIVLLEECLAIDTERGDRHGLAYTYGSLAHVHERRGRPDLAASDYQRSLALHREVGDRHSVAITIHNLGEMARRMGRLEEARRLCSESLELFLGEEARHGVAFSLLVLGDVARETGELEIARSRYREALDIFRALEYGREIGLCLTGFGLCADMQGDARAAVLLLSSAEAQWRTRRLPVPSEVASEIDGQRARLRSSLGEEAFDRLWREGMALTVDDAVRLVEAPRAVSQVRA